MNWLLSPSLSQTRAACSAAAPFDLLLFAAVRFAAVMPAAAGLEAARLGSEKFDPAPARATPLAPAGSGRRATYGTTFGYPAETQSVDAIILPIAIGTDRVLHLFGRRLAPESYPLFSQCVVAEVRFGVACATGRKRGIHFCEIDPREPAALSFACLLSR